MAHRTTPYIAEGYLYQPAFPARVAIAVGSPAWYTWLDAASTRSFAFHDPPARFTARKERRQRGGSYWSAYRNARGKTVSVYLGTAAALSLERLQTAAARLAGSARPAALPPPSGAELPPVDLQLPQISRPQPRPDFVWRPRLLARLDAGLRFPVMLITAPAGFGKTTTLSFWFEHAQHAIAHGNARDQSLVSVGWITADSAVDAPDRFVRALINALHACAPNVGDATLALLAAPQPPPLDVVVSTLVADLSACQHEFVLILDDYHALTQRDVHRVVTLLIEQFPRSVRLIIASREEPPLPLPRWRARGMLAELHADDLRFAYDEAAAFLRNSMGVTLSDASAAVLAARTEGWAAGLQLAALALQGHPDSDGFIATFAGNNRLVFDYLSTEVLAALPSHLQEFLLQTSILDQLCGSLCDAVLGMTNPSAMLRAGDERRMIGAESARSSVTHLSSSVGDSYSQLLLDEIERRNLFLTPLDLTRSWYRYHHLFREVLRRRLTIGAAPGHQATLHRRAAGWFAAQRSLTLVEPALHHALAAGDDDYAADVLLQHAPALLRRLDFTLLRDWIARMPPALMRRHARLALIAGWTLTLTGQLREAMTLLDEAMIMQAPPSPPGVVAEAQLISAMNARLRGDLPTARDLIEQALPDVDPADPDACTWAAYLHGFTALDNEDQEGARTALEAAVRLGAAAGQIPLALSALSRLGLNAIRRGQLTAAQACCDRAEALVAGRAAPLPAAGLADVLRGIIAYRRDDLMGAQRAVLQGIARLRGWIDSHMLVLGMIYHARCLQALREPAAALESLARADDWLRQRGMAGPAQAQLAVERARLSLRQGRIDDTARWAQGEMPPPQHMPQQLTLVRLWLAQAHAQGEATRLNQARAILQPLHEMATARGWNGDLNEIELLDALVLAAHGQNAAAVKRLAGVLARSEPEGALRVIADEGAPVIPLLHQIMATHRPLRRFARRLLNSILAADPTLEPASIDALTALTPREIEVLRLLAVGSSTHTIAEQLVVSPGTVKRHIGNILQKLAVHSRLEAVAQARDHGLI